MKKSLFLAVCALSGALVTVLVTASHAQEFNLTPTVPISRPAASLSEEDLRNLGEGVAFPYEYLDNVLRANVDKTGNVFYAKLKNDNDLATFARAVAIADLTKFPTWPVPADPKDPQSKPTVDNTPELTFWINAYNGLFLKAVADAYPVNSVVEIKGLDTDKTRVVAGKNYSFAELRQKIVALDPRGLFALPDGTLSGPRASAGVFRFLGLGAQLNAAISSFVNDPTRVKPPVRLQSSVEVSPWLAEADKAFKPKARKGEGIRQVLAGYTERGDSQRYFGAGDYQIKYLPWEGALNEQRDHN